MNLTAKGRYAVTAMLDLALHSDIGTIPLSDIVERQSISQSYLEQLFSKLRKANLVNSIRGPGGGYTLTRPATEISVADIIDAVDVITDYHHCEDTTTSGTDSPCLASDLWYKLSDEIRGFLSHPTLWDLMQREGIQAVALRQNQYQAEKIQFYPLN
jgi:Rrf2 family iron-sulfur cluster assembly transcriptional regulator